MVDRKTLEDGKVLTVLEQQFTSDPSDQNFRAVLECLTDSDLWVPFNAQLSEADMAQLRNAKKGDQITTKDEVHMKPDILQSGEELFFPIFSQKEQAPEEYQSRFSWMKLPLRKCISMMRATAGVDKMVLDAFSFKIVIVEETVDIVDKVAEEKGL